MNKLNLDQIQVKVTNCNGYEIFPNDIDNIKYRVVRLAHSLKDYGRVFSMRHWCSDKPINVKLVNFDPSVLLLVTPDMAPSLRYQKYDKLPDGKKPRDFFINNGSYRHSLKLVKDELEKESTDMAALHDYFDEAEDCLNETNQEKESLLITYLNTHYSHLSVDYNHAVMLYELFRDYLPKETVEYFISHLSSVKKKFEDPKFLDPIFRLSVPKLSKVFADRVSKDLKDEHYEVVKRKYPDHPALEKAEKQICVMDKMYIVLYKVFREKEANRSTRLSDVERIFSLFNKYLTQACRVKVASRIYQAKQAKEDDKVESDVKELISNDIKEDLFEAIKSENIDHPIYKTLDPSAALYERMKIVLSALEPERKKSREVVYSLSFMQERADRLKAIFRQIESQMDKETLETLKTYSFLQPGNKVKASDCITIDSFVLSIESNAQIFNAFANLYEELKNKLPNTRKVVMKRDNIKNAFKKNDKFKGFCLILDLQDYHKKLKEENASPTPIPPLHV